MDKEKRAISSAYRKIAIDIAENIVNGNYTEGQKLFGRSVLASKYQVSPETIRKAMHLLKDVGIVDIKKGSSVEVESVEEAEKFLERHQRMEEISKVKNEVKEWARKQAKETTEIIEKIQFIVDMAERLKNVSPVTPYEVKITKEALVINKTTAELLFWENTGGTIAAIRRGETLIVSPGPYATFNEGDIFYIIGDAQAYAASMKLIFG